MKVLKTNSTGFIRSTPWCLNSPWPLLSAPWCLNSCPDLFWDYCLLPLSPPPATVMIDPYSLRCKNRLLLDLNQGLCISNALISSKTGFLGFEVNKQDSWRRGRVGRENCGRSLPSNSPFYFLYLPSTHTIRVKGLLEPLRSFLDVVFNCLNFRCHLFQKCIRTILLFYNVENIRWV